MSEKTINVVAALVRDGEGRVLLVRKRGTAMFMQPGGKREPGEDDVDALARELVEELGCTVDRRTASSLGEFQSVAANEPECFVRASLYAVVIAGAVAPQAEIEEVVWVDPAALPALNLAPLTRDHVLPLASRLP